MRSGVATVLLALALLLTYLLELHVGAVSSDSGLLRLGALPDDGHLQYQYWRFLTFGLLHFNLNHLLLNTILLLWVGNVVERRIGASRLLVLFLTASVASGVAILIKHVLHPTSGASIGASGGVFGLLGAALVLLSRDRPHSSAQRIGISVITVLAFAYSLLPGVSMVGHVIGFVAGLSIASVRAQKQRGCLANGRTVAPN